MTYFERVAEIRRSAQRKTGNLYDTHFTRRVSPLVSAALAPIGATPNSISWANLVVGAASCLLIGLGDDLPAIAGVLLLHLYAILDSVDGELARHMKQRSLVGVFLENWSAYLMINGFMIAIASHLVRSGIDHWPLYVAVGLAAFGRSAAPAIRRSILEAGATVKVEREVAQLETPGWDRRFASRMRVFVEESLLFQTNVWVVLSTILILEVLVVPSEWHLLLIAFSMYSCASVAKEMAVVLLATRTSHLEREIVRISQKR